MREITVQGVLSGYRSTVDGGLKVTVELDELQAAHFHEGFNALNVMVALVRLNELETASEG